MNLEFITRVVGLVQKTNDRVVLADPQSGKAVVVMGLDAYESLVNVVPEEPAAPARQEIPVQRETMRLPTPPVVEKSATVSEVPVKTRVHIAVRETTRQSSSRQDLTQESIADNMNRDAGTWKTAQSRRIQENRPAVRQPEAQAIGVIEEEERFFLEPIE